MEELAKYIEGRAESLSESHIKKVKMWKEISKYMLPALSLGFGSSDTEGNMPEPIYDTNPIFYAREMADGLVGYIAPKETPWLHFRARDDELMKRQDVKEWFDKVSSHILIQLARSNFYDALQKYTNIGVTISTATVFVGDNTLESKPYFSVRHPAEIMLEENQFGDIDIVYRKTKISARNALMLFGPKNLSDEILKAVKETPFERFDFIHAVEYVPSDSFLSKYLPPGKKYISIYKEKGKDKIVSIGGYTSFPYGIWRYRVDGSEIYGRGPGFDALDDVRYLNSIAKSVLKGQQLASDPPLNIPIELKGKVRNYPHGANYYEATGRVVEPWRIGNVFQPSMLAYEAKKDAVKNHFYVDFFMVLDQITKRMTTVEVAERQNEKMIMLSTPISKFLSDGMDKILERVLSIELEAKRLPEPPTVLRGKEIAIDYFGLLAQLQQRMAKGGTIKQALIDIAPILKISPQTADIIDWDKTGYNILSYNNFPSELINDEKDVAKLRAKRAQAQQQEQAMQQLPDLLKIAQKQGGINGMV